MLPKLSTCRCCWSCGARGWVHSQACGAAMGHAEAWCGPGGCMGCRGHKTEVLSCVTHLALIRSLRLRCSRNRAANPRVFIRDERCNL